MGDIELTHGAYGGEAVAGYRAAVLTAVLGGLPLAFLAAAVLLATWRRSPRSWPPLAIAAFRAAFVLECASCLCSAMFLTLAVLAGPTPAEFFGEPVMLLMLATLAGSAAALPAWRTAMLAAATTPPSIRPVRPG